MSKRNKIKNRDDWARFAIGYLKLSRIVFEQIIEWNIGTRDNDQHKIEEVYLPAVFNLKHGIEILLKSLSIEFFEKEFLNESDYSHNIDDIFEKS